MYHLNIFKLNFIYLSSVSVCYDVCGQASVHVAGHWLTSPTMWVQVWNSGRQTWWQEPLPTKPSCQPFSLK